MRHAAKSKTLESLVLPATIARPSTLLGTRMTAAKTLAPVPKPLPGLLTYMITHISRLVCHLRIKATGSGRTLPNPRSTDLERQNVPYLGKSSESAYALNQSCMYHANGTACIGPGFVSGLTVDLVGWFRAIAMSACPCVWGHPSALQWARSVGHINRAASSTRKRLGGFFTGLGIQAATFLLVPGHWRQN